MSAKKSRAKRKSQMSHLNPANALKTFDPRQEAAANPFGALLSNILGRVDELTHAYTNLGKAGNEHFTDIIISRLMTNEPFMEKLATAVVRAGITAKQRADALHEALEIRRQSPMLDELPFVKVQYCAPEPSQVIGNDENGEVSALINSQIHSTIGFKPFEAATDTVEVSFKNATTEEGLPIREVARIYFQAKDGRLATLNPDSEHGRHLYDALNGNIKSQISSGAKKCEEFVSGSLAWVTMDKTIYGAPETPDNVEAEVEQTQEVTDE